jgi:hypothetical protein
VKKMIVTNWQGVMDANRTFVKIDAIAGNSIIKKMEVVWIYQLQAYNSQL